MLGQCTRLANGLSTHFKNQPHNRRHSCLCKATGEVPFGQLVALPRNQGLNARWQLPAALDDGRNSTSSEASTSSHGSSHSSAAPADNTSTLSSLDALLGLEVTPDPSTSASTSTSSSNSSSSSHADTRPWWSAPARQASPPRQTAMAPGHAGRFLANESWLSSAAVRVGAKTLMGEQLALPQVQPLLSYLLAALSASLAAAALYIAGRAGPGSAHAWLQGLALSRVQTGADAALAGMEGQASGDGSLLGLIGGLMAPDSSAGALLALYGLLALAPRVESRLGYVAFLSVFLLGGVSGEAGLLALTPPALEPAVCCSCLPALAALLGAQAVQQARNSRVAGRHAAMQAGAAQGWRAPGLGQASADTRDSTDGSQQRPTPHAGSRGSSSQQGGPSSSPAPAAAVACNLLLPRWLDSDALHGVFVGVGCGLSALAWAHTHAGGGLGEAAAAAAAAGLDGGGGAAWGMAAALGVGAGTGALLAALAGPRYDVSCELEIPEGAMSIPEELPEMVVVIDQTTQAQRYGVAALGSVLVAVAAGMATTRPWP